MATAGLYQREVNQAHSALAGLVSTQAQRESAIKRLEMIEREKALQKKARSSMVGDTITHTAMTQLPVKQGFQDITGIGKTYVKAGYNQETGVSTQAAYKKGIFSDTQITPEVPYNYPENFTPAFDSKVLGQGFEQYVPQSGDVASFGAHPTGGTQPLSLLEPKPLSGIEMYPTMEPPVSLGEGVAGLAESQVSALPLGTNPALSMSMVSPGNMGATVTNATYATANAQLMPGLSYGAGADAAIAGTAGAEAGLGAVPQTATTGATTPMQGGLSTMGSVAAGVGGAAGMGMGIYSMVEGGVTVGNVSSTIGGAVMMGSLFAGPAAPAVALVGGAIMLVGNIISAIFDI